MTRSSSLYVSYSFIFYLVTVVYNMLTLFGVISIPEGLSSTIVITLLFLGGFLDGFRQHPYRTVLVPFYLNLACCIVNLFSIVVLHREFSLFNSLNGFFENLQFIQFAANINWPALDVVERFSSSLVYVYFTALSLLIPSCGYFLNQFIKPKK